MQKAHPLLTSSPLDFRRLWMSLLCLVLAAGLLIFCFPPQAYITHHQEDKTVVTHWVWLDYITQPTQQGDFEGQLRLPTSQHLWLENTMGAQVILTLEGQEIYRGNTSAEIALDNMPSVVNFVLSYAWETFPPRGNLGLMQEGLLGTKHIIPSWQYDSNEHSGLRDLLRPLFWITLLSSLLLGLSSLKLSRRAWLGLLLIFGLSLVLRLITLNEKFNNDLGLWSMDTTWDNYVLMGRSWLGGNLSIAGSLYQQGNYVYMGLLQLVFGPSLQNLYLFNTLVGSFTPVLVTLTGWLLLGRRAGYLAGVLMAVFAPVIHYQHNLQVEAVMLVLMTTLTAGVAFTYKRPHILISAGCGVLIGLATLWRGSMIVMVLWPLLALIIGQQSLRSRLLHGGIVLAATLMPILPFTITNWNAGFRMLTPARGDQQFFRSNNLNAMGMDSWMWPSEKLAFARGESYAQALQRDLERDPLRPLELTVRRLALFFESPEHSPALMNDYLLTGLNASPTLASLSLGQTANFRILLLLACIGVAAGLYQPETRGMTILLGGGAAIYVATVALFYVQGRMRVPIAAMVMLLAVLALLQLVSYYRHPRALLTALFTSLVAMLGIVWLVDTAVVTLPRPALIAPDQLPTSFVPVTAVYDEEIALLGYAYYDSNFKAGGYLTFELFWKALQQPTLDYVVSLRFLNNDTRQVERNESFTLGTLSAPILTSSRWSPGDIFYERYFFEFPEVERSTSYSIMVGLFNPQTETLLPLTQATSDAQDNHLRLTGVGLGVETEIVSASQASLIVWDDRLVLESLDCHVEGEAVTLVADWWLKERPQQPQHMFVHLLDGDTVIAQQDAPPIENLPLDAWIPLTRQQTRWQFEGVNTPVTVRLGFYNPYTQVRWPMTSTSDMAVQDDYVLLECG